jgi:zinc protease
MRAAGLVPWILAAGMVSAAPLPDHPGELPDHPDDLRFEPLVYTVPDAASLRFELDNSIPVFAVSDPMVPLVRLELMFRGGEYLVPADKKGLAAIAGEAWRYGGAGDRSACALDGRLDTLAADLAVHIDEVAGIVSLDVLSANLEPAVTLLMDLLTRPRFEGTALQEAKANAVHRMRSRNDDPADIETREWRRLLFGDGYWLNRLPTVGTIDGIEISDCRSFVSSLIGAGNLVVAASGDFRPAELQQLLQRTIGRLPPVDEPPAAIPQPSHRPRPGVYLVDIPGSPQGHVRIGRPGYRSGHSDEPALTILNRILGGGDFTSRMVQRIRSDEGIAYAAWSEMTFPSTIPGHLSAAFQSSPTTCAEAARITMDIIDGLRRKTVTDDELETAVRFFVGGFPDRFSTPAAIVGEFAAGEITGRPGTYWTGYRDRIRSVTPKHIRKAAVRHLDPSDMIVLVVGDVHRILEGGSGSAAGFSEFGELRRLPLRDPMTLEPIGRETRQPADDPTDR